MIVWIRYLDEMAALLRVRHIQFIKGLYELPHDSLESLLTQHIRINGIYWALISLHLLNRPDVLPRDELIREILACRHTDGGFGSAPGHDPHVVCTLHAVQILLMLDAIDSIDALGTATWIASMQVDSGAIQGDKWGELDMRINYAATQCLALLQKLSVVDTLKLQEYTLKCLNFDGGFGMVPGAESHAAMAFTCLGTLSILSKHHGVPLARMIHVDSTAWWLCLRQLKNGGLNGRPEKLEDVCYSWWVIAALAMLDRVSWINSEKLRSFILSAQDAESGGISDRPGDVADINHTCFGLAGLALLGKDELTEIDPRYCLPRSLTSRLGL